MAACLAVGGIFIAAGGAPVRAAPPDLRVVAHTTYEVRPADRVIHVVVDGAATSFAPNSATTIYYFLSTRLVILGGATNLSASAAGSRAPVSVVESSDTQMVIDVPFNREVQYRQTASFRLEFDLTNEAAAGDVHVGANVGAFPVWAVGSSETPGSSVSISIPSGFELDIEGDELPDPMPRQDGGRVYSWNGIADPVDFGLYATADLATITESTYREFTTSASAGDRDVNIVVKAWADDVDWGERTSSRITAGLPILADMIGVDYFGTNRLVVVETVSRSLEGYAGIFDDSLATDEIQVAFDADDAVILHEAAHAWFNGALTSDRWILEGFAELYGLRAAEQLGIEAVEFELSDDLEAVAYPLSEWENPGLENEDVEYYGYAASFTVAQLLDDRAGTDGLATAFRAMAADEAAYQPLHAEAAEASYSHPSNWRYLLDILEERTPGEYADILADWVVPERQHPMLDERDHARLAYAELAQELREWEVPDAVRRQMNAWAFASATESINTARALLADRDELDARGNRVGVDVSFEAVQSAFERGSFDQAAAGERRIAGALGAFQNAGTASAEPVDALEWIGLLFTDPATDLSEATAALESGDWQLAVEAANAAEAAYHDAASLGGLRLAGGAAVLVVLGSAGVGLRTMRRLRREGSASAPRG